MALNNNRTDRDVSTDRQNDSESGSALERGWVRVRSRLRNEFGEAAFKNWLKALTLLRASGDKVLLGVPSKFWRDWIAAHYGDRLVALWKAENLGFNGVEIIVGAETKAGGERAGGDRLPPERNAGDRFYGAGNTGDRLPGDRLPGDRLPGDRLNGESLSADRAHSGRFDGVEPGPATAPLAAPGGEGEDGRNGELGMISTPLEPKFTFENFVIGKPNEFAYAAALRLAEADEIPFNPLFLYGGVGLGKTHLMHAIAWRILQRTPRRRVVFISSETFMYQFVRAVRFKDTHAFKEQFRSVDVLMIDDVQFFGDKSATQEELFHTFNALVDNRRQVIISADKPPVDLQGIEERLKSRLGSGVVAQLNPTNYELRLSVLQAKAERQKVAISGKVLEFLAHKITSNIRELEGAMIRLVAHATLLHSREISIDMAQEVLQDLLRANDRHVTIDDIQKKVCEHYNIKMADLLSPRRARAVARPRQVAMYLAKQLTTRSLPEIGRKFGGRDHTTIMHGVRKIEELRAGDPSLNEDVEILNRSLTR